MLVVSALFILLNQEVTAGAGLTIWACLAVDISHIITSCYLFCLLQVMNQPTCSKGMRYKRGSTGNLFGCTCVLVDGCTASSKGHPVVELEGWVHNLFFSRVLKMVIVWQRSLLFCLMQVTATCQSPSCMLCPPGSCFIFSFVLTSLTFTLLFLICCKCSRHPWYALWAGLIAKCYRAALAGNLFSDTSAVKKDFYYLIVKLWFIQYSKPCLPNKIIAGKGLGRIQWRRGIQ